MTHDAEREALLESAYDAAWEAVGRNATTTDAVMLRVRQKLSVEEIRRFMGTVVPAVLQARAASQPAQDGVLYSIWRQGFDAVAKWKASQPAQEPVYAVPSDVTDSQGRQLYTITDQPIPMADNWKLYAAPPADSAKADRILTLCGDYAMAYRNAPIAEAERAWKKLEREVRKPA